MHSDIPHLVRYLLAKEKEIDAQTDEHGYTALMCAAQTSNIDTVRVREAAKSNRLSQSTVAARTVRDDKLK
jgi:hypothetical protein